MLAKGVAQPGAVTLSILAGGPVNSVQAGKPFTNSLGMKFVSVPGSKVHLCIHETRKQDYAAYAAANDGVDTTWKTVSRNGALVSPGDDHPVVGVSWHDANAFCAWLSKKEGHSYRLPTEFEWNLAVVHDLSVRTNITAEALYKLIQPQYPWGNQWDGDWIPPADAGKYRDNAKQFRTTAPVMSFKPNALGIFDLGGNICEWCEDELPDGKRVLRGCSWDNYGPHLKSGTREFAPATNRDPGGDDYNKRIAGFRCVVEDEGMSGPEIGALAKPAQASAVPATSAPKASVPAGSSSPADKTVLFDGKTLNGWRVIGDASAFSIDNGAIKTSATTATLIYVGAGGASPEWKDFEFTATVKTGDRANSGVWFHIPPGGSMVTERQTRGFEVQVTRPNGDAQMTGTLYYIQPIKGVNHQGEWFKLRFTVKGNKFVCYIDGTQVNEWTQPDDWQPPRSAPEARLGKGTIAIPSMKGEVWFKDIEVKVF